MFRVRSELLEHGISVLVDLVVRVVRAWSACRQQGHARWWSECLHVAVVFQKNWRAVPGPPRQQVDGYPNGRGRKSTVAPDNLWSRARVAVFLGLSPQHDVVQVSETPQARLAWHRQDHLSGHLWRHTNSPMNVETHIDQRNQVSAREPLEITACGKAVEATENEVNVSKRLRMVFPPAEKGVDARVRCETTDGPRRDVHLPALEPDVLHSRPHKAIQVRVFDEVRIADRQPPEADMGELLNDMRATAADPEHGSVGLREVR